MLEMMGTAAAGLQATRLQMVAAVNNYRKCTAVTLVQVCASPMLLVRTAACTPGEVVMAAAALIATRASSVARSNSGMAPVTHCGSGPLPWRDPLDSIAPASSLQAGKHDALVADASAATGVLLAHSKSSGLCLCVGLWLSWARLALAPCHCAR